MSDNHFVIVGNTRAVNLDLVSTVDVAYNPGEPGWVVRMKVPDAVLIIHEPYASSVMLIIGFNTSVPEIQEDNHA